MRRVVIPLALGIAWAELSTTHPPTTLLLILLVGTLVLTSVIHHADKSLALHFRWSTAGFRLCLFSLFFLAGLLLHELREPTCTITAGKHEVMLQLRDNPQLTERSCRTSADLLTIHDVDRWSPAHGRVMLYFLQDTCYQSLSSGDILHVNTYFRTPDSTQLSPTFNYRNYLRRNGILLICRADSSRCQFVEHRPTSLRHHAQRIQRNLSHLLENKALTHDHQAASAALLLGQRDHRLDTTRQRYNEAGVVHLLCVSGLHVGLISWMLGAALSFIGNRRWQRLLKGALRLTGIWLFVIITGMAPATLRAGVMFSLFVIASMLRRRPDGLNTLFVSAFLMLIIHPTLLFDIGFQYSYAGMIGLITIHPHISALVPPIGQRNKKLRWQIYGVSERKRAERRQQVHLILAAVGKQLWDLASVSFSAQLLILPLTLYYFGQFPTYFLLANILIVPFAGLLLIAALAVVLLSFWPWAAQVAAQGLDLLLWVVDGLTARIGSLPHAVLNVQHFSIYQVLLTYMAVWLLYRFLLNRKSLSAA